MIKAKIKKSKNCCYNKSVLIIICSVILIAIIVLFFVINNSSKNNNNSNQIANPASVYCEENAGQLEIVTDSVLGGQIGYCMFNDGSECEEWKYFRGECKIGEKGARDRVKICNQDLDCSPNPGCHPTECVNEIGVAASSFNAQETACTMEYRANAAYSKEDCACVSNYCENKNKDRSLID
ncbi:MAG: DUF333 domain-containing protein [archaeon]